MPQPSASQNEKIELVESSEAPYQLPTPDEAAVSSKPTELLIEDIHTLFSGAPQFAINTRKGTREPSVSFPWDKPTRVKDLTDSPPLAHPAFSLATLRRHTATGVGAGTVRDVKAAPEYDIGVVEFPSMLTSQGAELGSVGFDHFLQLSQSDSDDVEDEGELAQGGLSEAARNREVFDSSPEKLGIRRFNTELLHERLVEVSELYQSTRAAGGTTILEIQSSGELYATLFGKFLTPPRFDPHAGDPTGLKVQIETLLRILQLKGIWYNFGFVEWRIRLGQRLWATADSALSDEDLEEDELPWNERDVLLLQILLACELYLRLDAVSSMTTTVVTESLHLTADEVRSFQNLKTKKTDWDLVLARRFLQDIKVVGSLAPPAEPKKRGFFASMTSASTEVTPPRSLDINFLPRHQSRQVSGLAFFAASIGWPNIDTLFNDLNQKLEITEPATSQDAESIGSAADAASPSIYATPLATPRSQSPRNSYFGSGAISRPGFSRNDTQRSIQLRPSSSSGPGMPAGPVNIGGWLSRAYLTGLIMPGEAISHLLISTLLENDSAAIAALGDSASLYGGFVYNGSSWWSKSCILGKVLAATEDAKECMGWILVRHIPESLTEGWVDVAVNRVLLKNRLQDDEIARSSEFMKDTDGIDGMRAEDLRLPLETNDGQERNGDGSIHFVGYHLEPIKEVHFKLSTAEELPPDEDTLTDSASLEADTGLYNAILRFSIPTNVPEDDVNPDLVDHGDAPDPATDRLGPQIYSLNLRNDVYFVSSYACVPPDSTKASLLSTPANGSQLDQTKETQPRKLPVHPMHTSHTYRVVSPAALVDPDPENVSGSGLLPGPDNGEVIVIDATTTDDAEVLARAWCAEKGFSGLIARRPRTCLSCAVREANGLGLKVVIRT